MMPITQRGQQEVKVQCFKVFWKLNTNNGTIFIKLKMTRSIRHNWIQLFLFWCFFIRSDNIFPEFRHIINHHSMTTVQITPYQSLVLVVKIHQSCLCNISLNLNANEITNFEKTTMMKYQILLVWTVENIIIKTNQSSFVYNYFFCVFTDFSIGCLHEIWSFKLIELSYTVCIQVSVSSIALWLLVNRADDWPHFWWDDSSHRREN